jgi:hypothetical protein
VKKKVKLEVKGDRVENKVLVSGPVTLSEPFVSRSVFSVLPSPPVLHVASFWCMLFSSNV